MIPVALSIAGSDPSGGAGIQADLKTFHQAGVYGAAAITLLTVQNTQGVKRIEFIDRDLVLQQIQAVLEDIPPQAAKLGALGSREVVEALAQAAVDWTFPLVIDPVMISKHGDSLMSADASSALRELLTSRAYLLTPNLHEAAALTGEPVEDVAGMRRAAERLCKMGARAVLVKGGHLKGEALDVLLTQGSIYEYRADRIETLHTHGTGCTYSAAITALLAKGVGLVEAVRQAKAYVTAAIRTNPGLGSGAGPLNHQAPWRVKGSPVRR